MTRINALPVSQLQPVTARSEYRESPRALLQALTNTKGAPADYKLGSGHVKFCATKAKWVFYRWLECRKHIANPCPRFAQLVLQRARQIKLDYPHLWQDYTPTAAAITENTQRLIERGQWEQ